jgi:hypothetical protein
VPPVTDMTKRQKIGETSYRRTVVRLNVVHYL